MSASLENATLASPTPAHRVALCEPDAPLARLMSEWLRRAGLEPVPCSSRLTGADVIVVVANVATPRLDGAAYIAALRTRFAGARVLAISGYFITSGAATLAHELGADALLAKPFSCACFLEAVRALL